MKKPGLRKGDDGPIQVLALEFGAPGSAAGAAHQGIPEKCRLKLHPDPESAF